MATAPTPLDLSVRLRFDTPLFIGSGPTTPDADKATLTDAKGVPLLPGSSLKGRVRSHCERLARSLGVAVCEPRAACPSDSPCVICLLFGSERRRGTVRFLGGRLAAPPSSDLLWYPLWPGLEKTALRTGVAINRRRRTAEDEKLFVLRTTAPGLPAVYRVGVRGHLPAADGAGGLLVAGLLALRDLGGGNSRGLGRLGGVELSGYCGDQQLSADDPAAFLDWLELELELLADGTPGEGAP